MVTPHPADCRCFSCAADQLHRALVDFRDTFVRAYRLDRLVAACRRLVNRISY